MTPDPARGPHLLLIGMMGTGKSTVGRLLSRSLGRPFVDVDAAVETRAGQRLANLFADLGEAGFRALEAKALTEIVATPRPSVVACGGGVVLDSANRDRLRASGMVVWLGATPAELLRRLGQPGRPAAGLAVRPLLAGPEPPAAVLERLAAERQALYRQTAHLTVATDGLTPGEVAEQIARELRHAEAGRP